LRALSRISAHLAGLKTAFASALGEGIQRSAHAPHLEAGFHR
jgi:hypothetical protein